jgi:hypothetical protein
MIRVSVALNACGKRFATKSGDCTRQVSIADLRASNAFDAHLYAPNCKSAQEGR